MSNQRSTVTLAEAEAPFFVGVDVGGTNIKIGLVDDLGRTLVYRRIPTQSSDGPEEATRRMGRAVRQMVTEAGLTLPYIARVGLGTPGTMDVGSGLLINPHNLPGWHDFPIRDKLSQHVGLRVTYANDANAAAYGEFWVGSGRDFNSLVVSTVDNVPVRIADLVEAVDLTKERRTLARYNGEPAVVLLVQRQSGMNTVEVIDAVKERLTSARALLPADVTVEVLQDQSRYIRAALHEIQNHLVSGNLMASVIVLLFMRSLRSTIIAAVAIPTSIVGAFAVMKAMDFTMNNVTMLALVLMVGVVIDDAIIVLENVYRVIEEQGLPPKQAAIQGTREIGLAVLATTLSLVIVFLPVSFLSSVTGRLLFEFGITASVAVMISMLVSFSLTPMMCSRMLKPVSGGDAAGRPASRHLW